MSPSTSSSSKICFNPDCKEPKSDPCRKGWRLRNGEYAELCDRCGRPIVSSVALVGKKTADVCRSSVTIVGERRADRENIVFLSFSLLLLSLESGYTTLMGALGNKYYEVQSLIKSLPPTLSLVKDKTYELIFVKLLDKDYPNLLGLDLKNCHRPWISAYEEVRFCETFHSNVAGWRNCESCGKKVHCGCIASMHIYFLLDAGGVECIVCARKTFVAASNQIWPSSLFPPPPLPDRLKDLSVKSWNSGPSSVPGPWWQGTNLWNNVTSQSEVRPRMQYDVDKTNNVDPSSSSQEKKKVKDSSERLPPTGIKLTALDRIANGNARADSLAKFCAFRKEESRIDGLQDTGHITGDDLVDTRKGIAATAEPGMKSSVSGMNIETRPNSCVNMSLSSSTLKDEASTSLFSLGVSFSSPNEMNDMAKSSGIPPRQQTPPPPAKPLFSNSQNGGDSSGDLQTIRNGRSRADSQRRNQLLPRYQPRSTHQELQKISGEYPLCGIAYFPTISQSEGLPLKVQDATGKEWVFQFRFWPNNNSRMYVLEGVTPCIQAMQLQAGDTVIFSRTEPEGKLIMGYRKASNVSSEQVQYNEDVQAPKSGNGLPVSGENNKNSKMSDVATSFPLRPFKAGAESTTSSPVNHINLTDSAYPWSKFDKAGYVEKDGIGTKSSSLTKRKKSTLGSKKRLRMSNDDSMELKLTWEEAQELLRPPCNYVPTVVVIEGHEFEEYETPVTMSSCSAAQEITTEQLEDLVFANTASLIFCAFATARSKRTKTKEETDAIEVAEGLDTLANLAILGEGEALPSSAQPTTKHPRHRPGCTCIVCIQPPSGKGPKHKQSCTCNVCMTVKRRFRTLMLRREKRQSEKEAERQKQQLLSPEKPDQQEQDAGNKNDGNLSQKTIANGDEDDSSKRKSASPFKGHIDLNIQPEREEEPSPVSDSGNMMRLLRDATDLYLKQQGLGDSIGSAEPVLNQAEPSCSIGGERPNSPPDNGGHPTDVDKIPMAMSASTSGTG
ncbi:hypothetical protein ACLOJK_015194 [Asimina triloba]